MAVAGRSHYRSSLWVGASVILLAAARFVPDSAVGLMITLFVLAAACTVAAAATINWRVVPWRRAEFFLFGATIAVSGLLVFVKEPATFRAMVILVVVLFVASVVMMIRGLVDMFRMVRRARADKSSGLS